MLIKEVSERTGLTKKAVEYYVKQDLLRPGTMENGYRNYMDEDLSTLKEISLLRKIGLSISDIRAILKSDDKPALLAECRSKMTRRIYAFSAQQACIDHLIDSGYDIDSTLSHASRRLDENRIIKEKLVEAFPGNYGLFVSFHFGRFLNKKIDSPEKEAAYGKILEYLDGLDDIPFPDELEASLLEASSLWNEEFMKNLDSATNAVFEDYGSFMKQNRESIESYLEYCKSDAFKSSPAYRMKTLLTEFQRASGYLDIFIENMKILSREYVTYLRKLQESNERFLLDYPEAADILG